MKEKIITLTTGIFAIIAVFGIYGYINYYINLPEQAKVEPKVVKSDIENIKTQQKTDFQKYLDSKKVDIYKDGLVTPNSLILACEDQNKSQAQCNEEVAKISKSLSITGEIKDAYLYIKAGVNRNNADLGPLTQYDSIWFYIDGGNSSGHLLRTSALVYRQSDDGVTELLFNLNDLPFTHLPYADNTTPDRLVNIVNDIFSKNNKHFIGAFVSTLGYGKILEMKIGYGGGSIAISE